MRLVWNLVVERKVKAMEEPGVVFDAQKNCARDDMAQLAFIGA